VRPRVATTLTDTTPGIVTDLLACASDDPAAAGTATGTTATTDQMPHTSDDMFRFHRVPG